MTGGYNPRPYKGKYSGKAGKNSGPRRGSGGSGNKGCGGKKKIVAALIIFTSFSTTGVWGAIELLS